MTPRDLTSDEKALKATLRVLVEACGGGKVAATVLDVSEALISGWLGHEPRFPSLTQVLRLERAAGQPVVSRWMTLAAAVDLPPAGVLAIEDVARLAREGGEVKMAIVDAVADGKVDAADRARVRREAQDLIALANEILRKVEA